jgi:hypothetical protein
MNKDNYMDHADEPPRMMVAPRKEPLLMVSCKVLSDSVKNI